MTGFSCVDENSIRVQSLLYRRTLVQSHIIISQKKFNAGRVTVELVKVTKSVTLVVFTNS